MKIVITENQSTRLFESNTALDNLNNLININDYIWEHGQVYIKPSSVFLKGNLDEDDNLILAVDVDEVLYNGKDVTEFAVNWALWPGEMEDTQLAMEYKLFLSNKLNEKILRLTPIQISEWDVELHL